jgi:signal transduction histidine kinase
MSNAINHSPKNGNITLEINENTIIFKNSGLVPIANPQNIYNRFSKEDPSSRSVGLGLAIVKKICDMHSIEIFYSFSEEMHCFKLVFQL